MQAWKDGDVDSDAKEKQGLFCQTMITGPISQICPLRISSFGHDKSQVPQNTFQETKSTYLTNVHRYFSLNFVHFIQGDHVKRSFSLGFVHYEHHNNTQLVCSSFVKKKGR